MKKSKESTKLNESHEETNNTRREFLGKAAIAAASLAVGSVVGGNKLFAQEAQRQGEIIIVESDFIKGNAGDPKHIFCLCDKNKWSPCLCNRNKFTISLPFVIPSK